MNNGILPNNNPVTAEHITLVAHDLRSIMSNIYGLNQLLAEQLNGQSNTELCELMALLNSQCQLGIELTSGIVSSYQRSSLNLNQLFTELQHVYKYKADDKGISLTISLAENEIYIKTERTKLIRILDNLLDNAIKFTPKNGRVNISLIRQNDKAIIGISDTGIGIPSGFSAEMFNKQPKTQRQGTANEPSTGLGLYISKHLTNELQGQLWFNSTDGRGTTFYLSFDVG